MIYQLSVPAAVPGVEEIRILEWHKEPGATVDVGELIVELETHKAIVEVRTGQAGILRQILAQSGDWLAIGRPLAVFSSDANEELPVDPSNAAQLSIEFEVS